MYISHHGSCLLLRKSSFSSPIFFAIRLSTYNIFALEAASDQAGSIALSIAAVFLFFLFLLFSISPLRFFLFLLVLALGQFP